MAWDVELCDFFRWPLVNSLLSARHRGPELAEGRNGPRVVAYLLPLLPQTQMSIERAHLSSDSILTF